MDAADDPDPDGWHIHPATAFYGLWPRFVADEAEDAAAAVAGNADGAEAQHERRLRGCWPTF